MAAPWLQQLMGPPTPPRVVSVKSKNQPQAQGQQFDMQALLKQLRSDHSAFNQAGDEQYGNMMSMVQGMNQSIMGPGGMYPQAFNLLSSMGQGEGRRIGQTEQKTLAASDQDLMSRGLGNTTVRDTTRRGIRSDAESARQDLAERTALAKAGMLERSAGTAMNLGQMTGDFMLSRQNVPPDMGAYTALLQSLSSMGGGTRPRGLV